MSDVTVKTFQHGTKGHSDKSKVERLQTANKLLIVIANCGRHFFRHAGRLSHFELSDCGHIIFVDCWSDKRIYTHKTGGRWMGFSEGGTLRSLITSLRDYIRNGCLLARNTFGPWPDWYCDGDLWGYGVDMGTVRKAALTLGVIMRPAGPGEVGE